MAFSLYTVLSVSAAIQVIDRRNGVFQINCTSVGGRAVTISVSGQFEQLITTEDIVPLGNPHGMGNDTFSAAFTLSGGRSGDAYYCLASNNMSMTSNHILLKGKVLH